MTSPGGGTKPRSRVHAIRVRPMSSDCPDERRLALKISLYIPCYNAEPYLDACLEGIARQTLKPDEIIIVNDGSSDRTRAVAAEHRVTIVEHPRNLGLGAARNTGVRTAAYELVASLDADCVPSENWLERLVGSLEDENVAGVGGRLIESNTTKLPDRWRARHMVQHWGASKLTDADFLFGNNTLFRKSALMKAGLYNKRLKTNFEDVAISMELRGDGRRLVYEPDATVTHLRRDTIRSIMRANWQWRFFGHQLDISFKNAFYQAWTYWARQAPSFVIKDLKERDLAAALLTCAAFAYGVVGDIGHTVRRHGEKGLNPNRTGPAKAG